jgi:hypothetical protein
MPVKRKFRATGIALASFPLAAVPTQSCTGMHASLTFLSNLARHMPRSTRGAGPVRRPWSRALTLNRIGKGSREPHGKSRRI